VPERKENLDIFEPMLTIGAVAKMVGVATQTVRMYEKEGVVLPHRTESGRRMYSVHDVDRLKCVRKMIVEHGMNLPGIKRMLSLLPCWEFKGGLDEQCKQCPAYYEVVGPCWSLTYVSTKCEADDCRSCRVYRMQLNCEKFKEVIFGHRRPETGEAQISASESPQANVRIERI